MTKNIKSDKNNEKNNEKTKDKTKDKNKDKNKDKTKNQDKNKKLKKQKGGGVIEGITNLINAFKGLGTSINNEISLSMNIQKDLNSGTQPAPGAPPN